MIKEKDTRSMPVALIKSHSRSLWLKMSRLKRREILEDGEVVTIKSRSQPLLQK
jgi:hypothetical protein